MLDNAGYKITQELLLLTTIKEKNILRVKSHRLQHILLYEGFFLFSTTCVVVTAHVSRSNDERDKVCLSVRTVMLTTSDTSYHNIDIILLHSLPTETAMKQ